MTKEQIKQLVASKTTHDGLIETGIRGVLLFRATEAIPCVPAVYEPCVIAIVNGAKEAILDGQRIIYDGSRYLCCPVSMPVQAGTPTASTENPLYGVHISLHQREMTELTFELEHATDTLEKNKNELSLQGIKLVNWDDAFTDALHRLLQLVDSPADIAILGRARLLELYYAIQKGEAGIFIRQAFGAENVIARSIAYISENLNTPISIDDMVNHAGMSRAVFHRKFKQVSTMAPIQFLKSMRLNNAAMNLAGGMSVSEAAMDVGYVSTSQFSREFKRMFGQSPRQWSDAQQITTFTG